jgi:hypothetical protein
VNLMDHYFELSSGVVDQIDSLLYALCCGAAGRRLSIQEIAQRGRFERYASNPPGMETLVFDGVPLVTLHPMTITSELHDDGRVTIHFNRNYEIIPTPQTITVKAYAR